jgi:hypothetical protein
MRLQSRLQSLVPRVLAALAAALITGMSLAVLVVDSSQEQEAAPAMTASQVAGFSDRPVMRSTSDRRLASHV